MTTPRDFRERATRRRADTRPAKITARNSDGTYEYVDTRTGQAGRAAPQRPRDSFAPGQYVTISSPDSSRNSIGSGSVILGTAPEESRAVARNARIVGSTLGQPMVSALDPAPVRLMAGIATPRNLRVRGFNLSAAPTSYGDAGITEASAEDITSSLVTCHLVASDAVPVGSYSVTVIGREFPAAIEVYEADEMLYAGGFKLDGSDYYPAIVAFAPSNNAELRVFVAPVEYINKSVGTGLIVADQRIFAAVYDDVTPQARIMSVSIDPDVATFRDSGPITGAEIDWRAGLAWNGEEVVFFSIGGVPSLMAWNPANGATRTIIAAPNANEYIAIYYDGTYYWLGASNAVARVTEADNTWTDVSGAACRYGFAHSGDYVYAADWDSNVIRKIDRALGTVTASLSVAPASRPNSPIISGSLLFVACPSSGGAQSCVKKIDLGTFTVSATCATAGQNVFGLAISRDGAMLYAGDGGAKLHRINLAAMTLTATLDTDPIAGADDFGQNSEIRMV